MPKYTDGFGGYVRLNLVSRTERLKKEKGGGMHYSVTTEDIKYLLIQAKAQFISISISNHSGQWSEEYFHLQGVKEFKHGNEKLTMILLSSPNNSDCKAIDARLVHGIKFDKYLLLEGNLLDQVDVVRTEKTPVHSH